MTVATKNRVLIVGLCFLTGAGPVFPTTLQAENPFRRILQTDSQQPDGVAWVAGRLDALEKQLAKHGTIGVKAPDVWGEARLTKHRSEFERILAGELENFQAKLNASIRASDQAFLSNALAIQATALSGNETVATATPDNNTPNNTSNPTLNVVNSLTSDPTITSSDQPDGVNASPGAVVTRTQPLGSPTTNNRFALSDAAIDLEPTVYLDQLKRYVNHLHEIRRINEGDDTADSPGYSLNLVRVPVSVIPGEWTDQGYGAEVTLTAQPIVTPETLPVVFRSLVINDLVQQFGLPLTQALNSARMEASALVLGEFIHTLEDMGEPYTSDAFWPRNGQLRALSNDEVEAAKTAMAPGPTSQDRQRQARVEELKRRVRGFQIWAAYLKRLDKSHRLLKQLGILSDGSDDKTACFEESFLGGDSECREALFSSLKEFINDTRALTAEERIRRVEHVQKRINEATPGFRTDGDAAPMAEPDATGADGAEPDATPTDEASPDTAPVFDTDPFVLDVQKILTRSESGTSTDTDGEKFDFADLRASYGNLNSGSMKQEIGDRNLRQFMADNQGSANFIVRSLLAGVDQTVAEWSLLFAAPIKADLAIRELKAEPLLSVVNAILQLEDVMKKPAAESAEVEIADKIGKFPKQSFEMVLETPNDIGLMEHMEHPLNLLIDVTASQSVAAKIETGLGNRARLPFPLSQFSRHYGQSILAFVLMDAWWRLRENGERKYVHFHEVQEYLREELQAAYSLLAREENGFLWEYAGPLLADAARSRRRDGGTVSGRPSVEEIREAFFDGLSQVGGAHRETTGMLAWAVLLESSLLNARLLEDVKRKSADPREECECVHPYNEVRFYEPRPNDTSRLLFCEYVKCNWPVKVFAIDPVTQDQNVGESFGLRRELQLAAALAFAGGRLSAQNLTRFVRRLELDLETISLNRTAVGFGHGSDTFGWRFYPRVQTPDIESNLKATINDYLLGGPSKDSRQRQHRLESGMRECVALVVMPSFLSHVRFDVRTEWFPLESSLRTVLTDRIQGRRTSLRETAAWSRDVQQMNRVLDYVGEYDERYRRGEAARLRARVSQLSRALPLQTLHSRVPINNTLRGFELFGHGVTDLGPQLFSYYGMPGIDTNRSTTLYLVGNGFNVHETRVMAGNRNAGVRLLSREVLEVTVPAGVQTRSGLVDFEDTDIVEVQVATPYGVTKTLQIPTVGESASGSSNTDMEWTPATIAARFYFEDKADNMPDTVASSEIFPVNVSRLSINAPASGALASTLPNTQLDFAGSVRIESNGTTIGSVEVTNMAYDRLHADYFKDTAGLVALLDGFKDELVAYLNTSEGGLKDGKRVEVRISGDVTIETAGASGNSRIGNASVSNDLLISVEFVEKPSS